MVNVSEFKEAPNKPFLNVIDVINGSTKELVINGEAVIKEFKSLSGSPYQKLVIPVVYEGKEYKVGVYAATAQRLALDLGPDTEKWVGARLEVKLEGGKKPYINVYVVSKGVVKA